MDPKVDERLQLYPATEVLVVLDESVGPLSVGPLSGSNTANDATKKLSRAFLAKNPFANTEIKPATGPATTARVFPGLGVVLGYIDLKGRAALAANNLVRSVWLADEVSLILGVQHASVTDVPDSWHIARLGISQLWAKGWTGKGVQIGHLDAGLDTDHPMLASAIAPGAVVAIADDGKVDSAQHSVDDESGHGTHTAGIIVGRPHNGWRLGVAPGASILSAKVTGTNSKTRLLGGLEWLVGQDPRVINISLGLVGYNGYLAVIFQRLRQRNILPVVAIGNEGAGTSRSPGNYVESLSVGAVSPDLQVWESSSSIRFNRHENPWKPDLVAPGVNIASARKGGGVAVMSGTSQAAPFVAGVAALLAEAKPGVTMKEIERAILATAKRSDQISEERGGRGLISPEAALAELTALNA